MADAEKPVLQSAKLDHEADYADDIYARREEERIALAAAPIALEADGSFHYHYHDDGTPIELFFDLFFVANLNNLTENQQINDKATLTAYIGWFAIIWTTWLQISLFDVRFVVKSTVGRVRKIIQFCIMMAFAAESSSFSPSEYRRGNTDLVRSFAAINLVLLISRGLLAVDYLVPLWYLRKTRRREVILPLALCVLIFTISTIIYAGIMVTFTEDHFQPDSYRAWYVLLAYEVVAMFSISLVWRVLSFKNTHLVKRLSLLTLIILGEGILGNSKQAAEVVGNMGWTAFIFGEILTIVLIIYFLWDLYFGKLTEKHFGTIKQQIYAILHFPYHLALALVLEGLKVWALIEYVNSLATQLFNMLDAINLTAGSPADDAAQFNSSVRSILQSSSILTSTQIDGFNNDINAVTQAFANGADNTTIDYLYGEFLTSIYNAILEENGLEVSPSVTEHASSVSNSSTTTTSADVTFAAYNAIFGLSFGYYLITAGVVLFMLAIFRWLMLKRKDIFDYCAMTLRVILGLFMCLLSLFLIQSSGALISRFADSGLFLPTFLLVLFAVNMSDRLFDSFGLWRTRRRRGDAPSSTMEAVKLFVGRSK